ncbi:SPOR domain-containing protein [Terricaulis sp.]|uniref:SPOR domain-containing protein n=1 Tax=Terricaulis sp. TaxID=2768686 RepID=UPI003783E55A
MHLHDEQNRTGFMIYVIMAVIAVAFGGFLWNIYSAPDVPRISPPAGAYKIQPSAEALTAPDQAEGSLAPSIEGRTEETETASAPPVVEAPMDGVSSTGAPQLSAAPNFVSNGPYVAQVAALQSEAAVEPSWRRLSSRAPQLFARAQLDVERADLGARGVYYRVRAGYFADRENAARFCERIRQMGQDCIAVAR